MFGVATAAEQRAYLVAELPSGDAITESRNGATAFQAQYGRGARRRAVVACPLQQIRPVDASRSHVEQHFAWPGHGCIDLGEGQHLRPARLGRDDSFHTHEPSAPQQPT